MKEAFVAISLVGSSALAFLAGRVARSHADLSRAIEPATQDVWPQPAGIDAAPWPAVSKTIAETESIVDGPSVQPPAGSDKVCKPSRNPISSDGQSATALNKLAEVAGSSPAWGLNTPASPLPQGDAHHGQVSLRPVTGASDLPPIARPAPVHWFRTLSDARAKSNKLYVVINDTATPPKSKPPEGYAGVILGSRDLFAGSTVAEVFQVKPPAVAIVEGERIIRRQNAEDAK